MDAVWLVLERLVYLLCAGSALALAGWLLARGGKRGPAGAAEAAALTLTACWSLSFVALGPVAAATSALLSLTYFGWLWALYRLFAHDERDKSVGPIRSVVLALAFVEDLEDRLPFYAERHMVKPGITGWAQINYPYGASIEDSRRKLEYDLYYAKNYTPFLDLLILLQTLRVVLWPEGAR